MIEFVFSFFCSVGIPKVEPKLEEGMGASWDPTTYPTVTPCPKCGCGMKQDGALVSGRWGPSEHCIVWCTYVFGTFVLILGWWVPFSLTENGELKMNFLVRGVVWARD